MRELDVSYCNKKFRLPKFGKNNLAFGFMSVHLNMVDYTNLIRDNMTYTRFGL